MRTVAILIVGDEVLSGEVVDANGPYLLEVLSDAGVEVVRVVVVPDRRDAIAAELRRLRALADSVVVSGGIGPTHDDVTRPAVAEALGIPLAPHEEAARRVAAFYPQDATAEERAMALLPRGARIVPGERTGTFGFEVSGVFAFPGVPALFRDLARTLPRVFQGRPLQRAEIRTDRREGEIAGHLAAAQARSPDVAIGSYPVYDKGSWRVRIVLRAEDPGRLEAVARQVREAIEGDPA